MRLTTFHSVTEHDSTAGTSDGGNDRLYNRRRVLVNMRSFLARRAGAFGPPVACSRCCRGRPQGRLRGRRPERPELRRSPVKRLLPCVEARPRRRVRADESSESLRMYRAHTKKRERRSLRESGDRVRPGYLFFVCGELRIQMRQFLFYMKFDLKEQPERRTTALGARRPLLACCSEGSTHGTTHTSRLQRPLYSIQPAGKRKVPL